MIGILALVSGAAMLLFCYCFPYSLGLLIYGLIVYLSPDAEAAFRWRQENPY